MYRICIHLNLHVLCSHCVLHLMCRDLLQQRECEAVSHVKESMTMVESSLMEKEQVRGFTITSSSPSYIPKMCNVEVHKCTDCGLCNVT